MSDPAPPSPGIDAVAVLQARRAEFAQQLDQVGDAMLEGWGEPEQEDEEP